MAKAAAKKTTAKKTGRPRQTAGKSDAKRRPAARVKSVKKTEAKEVVQKKNFLRREMTVLLTGFLGLFLFLSNFGLLGKVGGIVAEAEKGLFGLVAYVFPLLLLLAAILYKKERGSFIAPLKFVCMLLIAPVLAGLMHLLFGTGVQGSPLSLYHAGAKGTLGGGMLGGMLANFLRGITGRVGAYLILILLFIIFMVVVTERSFVSAARAGAKRTANAAREGQKRYAEHHAEVLEQRRLRREEEAQAFRLEEDRLSGEQAAMCHAAQEEAHSDEREIARQAQIYAGYGRDIIGEEQPGISEEDDLTGHGMIRNVSGDVALHAQDFAAQQEKSDAAGTAVLSEEDALPVIEIQDFAADNRQLRDTDAEIARYDTKVLPRSEIPFISGEAKDFTKQNAEKHVTGAYETTNAYETNDAGEEMTNEAKPDLSGSFSVENMPEGEPAVFVWNEGFEAPGQPETVLSEAEIAEAEDMTVSAPTAETDSLLQEGMQTHLTEHAADTANLQIAAQPGKADAEDDYEDAVPFADAHVVKTIVQGNSDSAPSNAFSEETASFTAASGRELRSPSAYEAGKILEEKAAASSRESEQPKAHGEGQKREAPQKQETAAAAEKPAPPYCFPPLDLLKSGPKLAAGNETELREIAIKLQQVLKTFGVGVTVTNVTRGPSVTRYELSPDTGVKVSRITSLVDDIKLALAAADIRIEAPIPGKSAVGIEVPNKTNSMVYFRDLLESDAFKEARSKVSFCVGRDIQGQPVIGNIAKMPHLLIAGATGSGKSVGINTLIMSLIYKAKPEEVRMIMIDPKVVELSVYDGIPHLLIPVVTNVGKAVSALGWAVAEMNDRYQKFAQTGTRNISGYNEKIGQIASSLPEDKRPKKMTQIVIIIDELAELMMNKKSSGEVEDDIVRLAQLARAAGIHLIIATQRPSVDVITGLIKANVPSRIAFKTTSGVDSRTILDMVGAETLLGNGDMLYKPVYEKHPIRVQGAFVSDDEVERVVKFLKQNGGNRYETQIEEAILKQSATQQEGGAFDAQSTSSDSGRDEYFADAGRLITEKGRASIGLLQRMYKIGFNRAARLMDQLGDAGVVGEEDGTKPRKVLMTKAEFETFLANET